MSRLPSLRDLTAGNAGWGFFLCLQKEARQGRGGTFLSVVLQDRTGTVEARVLDQVERLRDEFDAGEFVKAQGRAVSFNGRLQFQIDAIRRVAPDQDRAAGFSEEAVVPSAPRPVDAMWAELEALVAGVAQPHLRALLAAVVAANAERFRTWPAGRVVHHAYRGGFLEHVLKVAEIGRSLAAAYDADADLVIAGAVLHDIGKLQELHYDLTTSYTRDGNLVGHITLGAMLVADACRAIDGFPDALRSQLLHLVASHHGAKEFGSPVEPMTVEAFILAMADDLDAKIHQVRRAVYEADGRGEFTGFNPRLGRVLWKGEPGA